MELFTAMFPQPEPVSTTLDPPKCGKSALWLSRTSVSSANLFPQLLIPPVDGNSALGLSCSPNLCPQFLIPPVWEQCSGTISDPYFHSSWFDQCVGTLHWDYPTALCTHSPNLFPQFLSPPVCGNSALGLAHSPNLIPQLLIPPVCGNIALGLSHSSVYSQP